VTTNETSRADDRDPATDVFAPDEAADEPTEGDEPRLVEEPAPEADQTAPVGIAQDDTIVEGDPSVDGPLLADATRYQDRWYEIQTGFVDEPRHAVQSAGELLTEMMDDLTRRLTTELGASDVPQRGDDGVSTEDLRVTFQRYRAFFDRLLAA
jgi:hypothetical protein